MIFTPKPWSDKILNLLDIIVYVTDKNYILLDTHYFPYEEKCFAYKAIDTGQLILSHTPDQ